MCAEKKLMITKEKMDLMADMLLLVPESDNVTIECEYKERETLIKSCIELISGRTYPSIESFIRGWLFTKNDEDVKFGYIIKEITQQQILNELNQTIQDISEPDNTLSDWYQEDEVKENTKLERTKIATVLEFLLSLDWQMKSYEVTLKWIFENKCPVCGKHYYTEDEEYSCQGQTVNKFKEIKGHHFNYPFIYKTPISECEINIVSNRIIIEHTEMDNGAYHTVCGECKQLEN